MSASQAGVLRAARTVANAEGDWAEVDPAIRDAIVLAITQGSPAPLRRRSAPTALNRTPRTSSVLHDSPMQAPSGYGPGTLSTLSPSTSGGTAPLALTEGVVQSSIRTFEDAAWVRDEAVRSYAEFHNTVEALHASMRTQLHPVWRTAMQLRPDVLAQVRDSLKLSRKSEIPEGVPIAAAVAQHIAQQEMILDEVEDTLQMLRNTSVRLAAHFLADEEKISLGANPAYLRAPDIDREVVESHQQQHSSRSPTLSVSDAAAHTDGGRHSRRNSHGAEAGLVSSRTHRHHHRGSDGAGPSLALAGAAEDGRSHRGHHRRRSSRDSAAAAAPQDPLLDELRQQYQRRVKELERHQRRSSSGAR